MNIDYPDVVVVVPCFNESARFPHQYWSDAVKDLPSSRLLFVDDGSTDTTYEVLATFVSTNPRSSVLRLKKNSGKSQAIRTALLSTIDTFPSVSLFATVDSDGSFSTADLKAMIALAKNLSNDSKMRHLVMVYPTKRHLELKSSFNFRAFMSLFASLILNFAWRQKTPKDLQVGMKVFVRNDIFCNLLKNTYRTRWFFEWELVMNSIQLPTMFIKYELTSFSRIPNSRLRIRTFGRLFTEIVYLKICQLRFLNYFDTLI